MTYDEWLKVPSPWRVVEAARECDKACQAALSRIIDTMLEIQLVRRHDNPGYQPFSVTGNVPMPSSGKVIDSTGIAAERMRLESEWHKACEYLMGRLNKRGAAAMLMQAARIRPEKHGESVFQCTANQMVERQDMILIALGMMDGVRPFDSVESLQKCGRRARNTLREWIAQKEISVAA